MPGPDVFDQLLSAKWRDIEFPVTRMRLSIAHDIVEHKYWGVDGARVESTGLAPLRFTFSAPLLNGIQPGKNERWAELYPTQMRKLLAAFQKKDTGMLQHPEFGLIVCKAERFEMDWDATRRGGVDAELAFVETLTDAEFEIRDDSPVKLEDPAKQIDHGRADLKALLLAKGIELPEFKDDLSTLANKVKAVADYPTLLSYRAAGQVNAIVYRANRIAQSATSARTAMTWPIIQNVERIKEAGQDMTQNQLAGSRDIGFFKVPAPTTLAGVVRQIAGAKVGDLIKLNPELMRGPEIPKNTIVRHYIARAA